MDAEGSNDDKALQVREPTPTNLKARLRITHHSAELNNTGVLAELGIYESLLYI